MKQWWNYDWQEKTKYLDKNLQQFNFVHKKWNMDLPWNWTRTSAVRSWHLSNCLR
jgi:hypothetical protein